MRIKDIEHHHPLLKLLAGYMTELVVTINEISSQKQLVFSLGRTIEMTVEYEGTYSSSVQPGSQVLIDIETGEITRLHLEATEPTPKQGITQTLVG